MWDGRGRKKRKAGRTLPTCDVTTERHYSYTEKQRYDGWFNNLAHPDWGSVVSQRLVSTLAKLGDTILKPTLVAQEPIYCSDCSG
uniref:Uncharacterized protein n=1 Tax=Timema cristinae TaxID=61476 RepID=A0A7R9CPG3_TIMCR|nr:unnamed protein product [Timema cristinae]